VTGKAQHPTVKFFQPAATNSAHKFVYAGC